MSKKPVTKSAEVSQEDFEAELKSEPKVFDTPVLGIVKTTDGLYKIVKVMISAKTMEAGEPEILDTAESKSEANEKFKINVVRQGIL